MKEFEETGFWEREEGTARGAFFNHGRNHDVVLYSLLRDDPRPWHAG
jgi:[ribosomal protein S5]-alanine N-acetyltransferase